MKKNYKTLISLTVVITLSVLTLTMSAQETNKQSYEKTKKEIVATFGLFPQVYDAVPEYALSSLWESFKTLNGPNSALEPKYRELISLAVSAQIPCSHCVAFHTESAKALGATQHEIEDAIAQGAFTRQMSIIIQGAQIDLDESKKEMHQMTDYMAKQAKKK